MLGPLGFRTEGIPSSAVLSPQECRERTADHAILSVLNPDGETVVYKNRWLILGEPQKSFFVFLFGISTDFDNWEK